MRSITSKTIMITMLAVGVTLGGCATRESVRNAQGAADQADRHAGTAQARADEAYGVGNNAMGVGNNALTSAQLANQKADQNGNDVASLKRKVAYLEHKVLPHKKRHHRHHTAAPVQQKPNNS
jgi:hypothetical protein